MRRTLHATHLVRPVKKKAQKLLTTGGGGMQQGTSKYGMQKMQKKMQKGMTKGCVWVRGPPGSTPCAGKDRNFHLLWNFFLIMQQFFVMQHGAYFEIICTLPQERLADSFNDKLPKKTKK